VGFWAGYLGPASQNKALYDGLYAFIAASIALTVVALMAYLVVTH
jgi:hypothetical protein